MCSRRMITYVVTRPHTYTVSAWFVRFAADLGCGSTELIEAFAGVDVLALEYNHDELMERSSSRPKFLVDRVLSDMGHLSNKQAAELTAAIAGRSGEGFPAHLVQLHLSKDCNKPELAAVAGREALVVLNPAAEVITETERWFIVDCRGYRWHMPEDEASSEVIAAARPIEPHRVEQPVREIPKIGLTIAAQRRCVELAIERLARRQQDQGDAS